MSLKHVRNWSSVHAKETVLPANVARQILTVHHSASATVLNRLEVRLLKVRVSDMKSHNIWVSPFLYIKYINVMRAHL